MCFIAVNEMLVVSWVITLFFMFCSAAKGYEEFLICPESPDTRTVSCEPGEVIDVDWARVANLEVTGVLDPCADNANKMKTMNNSKSECVQDLPFLSCHGRARCEVNPTMARVWLPGCHGNGETDTRGNWSDVLFVAYMCHMFYDTSTISLPSTSFISAYTVDVISPGFPDVMPDDDYEVSCNLSSREPFPGNVTFRLERRVVEFEGSAEERDGHCHFTVDVYTKVNDIFTLLYLGDGHRDGVVCYIGNPINVRNHLLGGRIRDSWILRFLSRGTKHGRFWIRFTALGENNAPVVMNVSCVDNSPTTTAAPSTVSMDTGEAALTKGGTSNLIVGVSVGVVLLILVVVIIVVTAVVGFRRKKRASEKPNPPIDPSAPLAEESMGVYSIASAIDGGNINGIKAPNSVKPEYAPNGANPVGSNDEGPAVYAVVNKKNKKNKTDKESDEVPVVYAAVNKKNKKNKADRESETIMCDNSELYERGLKQGKENPALVDETVMCENSDLYEGVSSRQPNNDDVMVYDDVRYSDGPIMGQHHN